MYQTGHRISRIRAIKRGIELAIIRSIKGYLTGHTKAQHKSYKGLYYLAILYPSTRAIKGGMKLVIVSPVYEIKTGVSSWPQYSPVH
jgi:hypothetical protein